jgi:transcriptional regulator with XRE-family HTH domain
MSVFGKLLAVIRKEQGLTQEELVQELAEFSLEFEGLNSVTISRWETGTTSTSFRKKREIFKFFCGQGWLDSGPGRDFVRERFEYLSEPLTRVFKHNYETLIANVPALRIPLEEYRVRDLQQETDLLCYEHIVDVEVASNPPGYYRITPQALQSFCHHPAAFSLICERKEQHLGHFAMFKLNHDAARRLVHNQLGENDIGLENFCAQEDRGSYYIHALYGVNPTIAALVNSQAYLYLFDHIDEIETISIFSSRRDGMRLAQAYGIETVAWGRNHEYGFTWYGMQSPVEDIVFSDTVLKLIF